MLTTATQQSVKIESKEYLGVDQYSCTCYGDDTDKNTYYVVPETPVFSSQNGKPKFMFYKYRSDDQQGGYAMFTVELPQPTDEMKDKIKAQLFTGVSSQLEAKSKLIVELVKADIALKAKPTDEKAQASYKTALKNTGLNADQAKKYETLYNSEKGDDQFLGLLLPESAQKIKLQQPNYTTSKASLILDDNKAFYRQIPTALSPSGLGDNNTVFSLSLTGEGATLFQKVLEGSDDNASVGIRFDFNLNASLPAAKVTVNYDSEKTKEVTQKITHHTWSADEKKVTRQFTESGAVSIKVDTGLTAVEMGMSQDQYNKWKQGLRDWGQKQVEQILSSQTGLDMSLNLLNDADGYKDFTEKLTETKSFTRVYDENSVVAFSIAPQSQLASIKSIVGADNLSEYFKEYDLKDPFFQYLQPEFYVTDEFKKYNITNIIVTAKYDNNNMCTLTFDANKSGPQKTEKWFIDEKLGRAYSYSYTVNFAGAKAKAFNSGEIKVSDTLVETINVDQCGIVYADIAMLLNTQSWQDFSQIVLKTQYSDSKNDVEVKVDTQIVTEANPPKPYIYPIGMAPKNPIYYTAEYYTKDGNNFSYIPVSAVTSSQMPGYASTRANQIEIVDALPKTNDYSIIFLPDPSKGDIQLITFEMVVNYASYHFKQTKSLTLTEGFSAAINKSLSFDFLPEAKSNEVAVTYSASVYFKGNQKPEQLAGVVDSNFVIINC